jgi:protein-S-isoprenylcysteine O-methyltransferase Ste14
MFYILMIYQLPYLLKEKSNKIKMKEIAFDILILTINSILLLFTLINLYFSYSPVNKFYYLYQFLWFTIYVLIFISFFITSGITNLNQPNTEQIVNIIIFVLSLLIYVMNIVCHPFENYDVVDIEERREPREEKRHMIN